MRHFFRITRRLLLWLLALAAVGSVTLGMMRWQGYLLLPDEPDPEAWEVFGVDVSAYQGRVDWLDLKGQGVDFAFMKATEGSSLQDRYFTDNWSGAVQAGIRPGAYHFFSYDSPGETQADNFIAMVPVTPGALPPVVDIEFYGDKLKNLPEQEDVKAVLDPLLARLEEYYGQKPILYVTYRSYRLYIAGEGYGDYPLWISSPIVAPVGKNWSFWQYSHSAQLTGYSGPESSIDLDIFNGTMEEFRRFGQAK